MVYSGQARKKRNQKLTRLAVYISPHPDDWQLFYGYSAFCALKDPLTRVVFIYLTAGDAGRESAWWQTRERGAIVSSHKGSCLLPEQVFRSGHQILKCTQTKSSSYFLRLPDGMPGGEGSDRYGRQSLQKLQCGASPLSAVDRSSHYLDWQDLIATVRAIVDEEAKEMAQKAIFIHAPEKDARMNPDDHSDHRIAAQLVEEALKELYTICSWLTYVTYYLPENLNALQQKQKQRAFINYCDTFPEKEHYFVEEWLCWGGKEYRSDKANGAPISFNQPLEALLERGAIDLSIAGSPEVKWVDGVVHLKNRLTQKEVILNESGQLLWSFLEGGGMLSEMLQWNVFSRKMLLSFLQLLYEARLLKCV